MSKIKMNSTPGNLLVFTSDRGLCQIVVPDDMYYAEVTFSPPSVTFTRGTVCEYPPGGAHVDG